MSLSKLFLSTALTALVSVAGCGGGGGSPKPVTPALETAGWTRLGSRSVDGKIDRDTIVVGADSGRFRVVRIDVEKSALEMFDVIIHFGDGTTFSPTTRMVFDKDTSTRVIDLPGGNRVIQRVDFKYGNIPGGGAAEVSLYAR